MRDYRPFRPENPYWLCERKLRYWNGRHRPCRSPYCVSDMCRSKGAEKDSAILMRSFKVIPPNFASVLRFSDDKSTSAEMLQACLKTFTQKMANYCKSTGITIKHDIRIEFVNAEPHCHLTILTSAKWANPQVKKLIRSWWVKSCPERWVSVYAKQILTLVGYAKVLWKEQCEEWYPKTSRPKAGGASGSEAPPTGAAPDG